MKRREFLRQSGTGVGLGLTSLPTVGTANDPQAAGRQEPAPANGDKPAQAPPSRTRYEFEIEIVEGSCGPHRLGQNLRYPDEKGKICPWLMDSMNSAIRVLEYGGTLPWMYTGTPYEKTIDPNGTTTEFIRCPDPSRVVVAKIIRRRV